ncbi:MAG: hypothetical protein ACFWT7_04530 [Succiniclasticum sp.]|jgi:hypothetical protein
MYGMIFLSQCSVVPSCSVPPLPSLPVRYADDGHGDYNRSYDQGYDGFDYADYSTDREDDNFRTRQKKKRKTKKEIIDDILNRWD